MHKHSFYIDKLTNSIEDAASGKNYDTDVIRVTSTDLKIVLKKNKWNFNWKTEFKKKERQLYSCKG